MMSHVSNRISFGSRRVKRLSFLTALSFVMLAACGVFAQPAGSLRVGERITYTISFDKYPSAGTAEMQIVSRGRLGNKDAIEFFSKIRTHDLFSASVLLLDETSTSIIAADSGMPLFTKRTRYTTGLPKEQSANYTDVPAPGYDLLSLIYRLRYSDGGGAVTIVHEARSYPLTYISNGTESVTTPSGDHETVVTTLQSDLFTELGIKDVRVNFDTSPFRIPILFRAKMQNGEMRIAASSVQTSEPEVAATPVPIATPLPIPVATPMPTPEPYVDDRPLSDELAFDLREVLSYKILSANVPVGVIRFHARERKLINAADTLVLEAEMNETNGASGLGRGNKVTAHVDPLTLLPRKIEVVFPGRLSSISQSAIFNDKTGKVTFGPNPPVDVPVGTHSVLSLFYAIRSFKLKPSTDPNNPVNDTRVAVFWGTKAHVFYIRPTITEITLNGKAVPALLATITTEDPTLNQLGLKLWLSDDVRRIPLRFSIGPYIFELDQNPPSSRP
jgi:hypothetical protein